MEFLGREAAGVVSIACSSASTTSFATLSSHGTLSLWDVRIPRRNYMKFRNPNSAATAAASELRYLHDRHAAVALCGKTVQLFDTRKCISCVSEFTSDKECVAFLRDEPPPDSTTTLIVDEDGGMFAYDIADGTRPPYIEAYVFGQQERCPLPKGSRFGCLTNYCSGLHCVDLAPGEDGTATRLLFAVGMDGEGALYSGADDTGSVRVAFSIAHESSSCGNAPMVNPPLVNCTAICGAQVAVGRADGMYSVYEIERSGLDEAMVSPGHAVNGLCYVDWVSPELLLTVSLCGEVTGWAVGAFMAGSSAEAEEEAEGPEVVAALAHREVPGCQLATVNCADRLAGTRYIFGDHLGGVTLAQLDL
ncbi:hypothetical protein conserved [Leishmania donovani]|uniref:Hypothetical_protein_conserved n=1 Tax=Leishmania donovani TaxID=5661 RepID=A0A6J8FMD5_LEIDO|nr:hypothetical protein conserved [Leishmania donovani]VDZ47783.1 hypothetical_protein_conserved [Leishmania donovani]